VSDLVISGIRGRMGQALVRLVERDGDVRIIGGIGRHGASGVDAERVGCPRIVALADAGELVAEADVVIDFSNADGTHELLRAAGAALAGRALVVGTTALDTAAGHALDELAGRAAVLTAANFSIGMNLLVALAERAAAVLDAGSYDAEIVEAHHRRKVDAPSGTALVLGEAVARGRGRELADVRIDGRSGDTGERGYGEIALHAIRGGGVVGDHQVLFLGERERIELRHEAFDRALFAEGALRAARWLDGREPGRYSMAQVLGLAN
jgi:4-hydroxy-tetrahydrodipicolinate reductase